MRFLARFLSALGLARLADVMARAFNDRPLPRLNTPQDQHQWSYDQLVSLRQKARYYAVANLIRGALYVPVLYGLAEVGSWIIFALIAALVGFHLVCMFIEIYRWSAAFAIRPSTHPEPYVKPKIIYGEPEGSWYFTSKWFESDRLYKAFGFETIRFLVDEYVNRTQLTAAERRAGKKVKYLGEGRQGLLEFEAETRQAEGMHLAAGLLNVPPLIALGMHGSAIFWWNLPIFVIDMLLVLVQRYHRTRVNKVLERKKPEPAAVTETVAPVNG